MITNWAICSHVKGTQESGGVAAVFSIIIRKVSHDNVLWIIMHVSKDNWVYNILLYIYNQHWRENFFIWWNFHYWLHWKLSKWQLSMQPVMKMSSKWHLFQCMIEEILRCFQCLDIKLAPKRGLVVNFIVIDRTDSHFKPPSSPPPLVDRKRSLIAKRDYGTQPAALSHPTASSDVFPFGGFNWSPPHKIAAWDGKQKWAMVLGTDFSLLCK